MCAVNCDNHFRGIGRYDALKIVNNRSKCKLLKLRTNNSVSSIGHLSLHRALTFRTVGLPWCHMLRNEFVHTVHLRVFVADQLLCISILEQLLDGRITLCTPFAYPNSTVAAKQILSNSLYVIANSTFCDRPLSCPSCSALP